jgi:hypothetical protein
MKKKPEKNLISVHDKSPEEAWKRRNLPQHNKGYT